MSAVSEEQAAARHRERLFALQAYRRSDRVADVALAADVLLERLSRELRTPLNAVLGFAHLLSLEVDEAGQREAVDQILRAGDQLQSLLDGLVGAHHEPSRGASGAHVGMEQAARAASGDVALLARARSVALRLPERRAATDQPAVHADPLLLHDAVSEMLAAAVRHARSEVAWACAVDGDRVVLTVVDDGPMTTPADSAPSTDELDLGLAVARRLAALLDGDLTVGASDGGGHAVVLDLPASPAPLASRDARTMTVLYVEDNVSNARLVQRLLARRQGTDVTVARTGAEGLALARSARPDVVLLDLHLPDMSGEDVLAELRAAGRDAPAVVLLTADAVPSTIERLLASGAGDYLTKPLDVARFYAVLDRLHDQLLTSRAC